MGRFEYYEKLKVLARQVRQQNGFTTSRVTRTDLRRVYKSHGIALDLVPNKTYPYCFSGRIRGAYFRDESGATVMLNGKLPLEPRVFTMAHELKHHLVDSHLPVSFCGDANAQEHIEIGAEVFAAELIFPDELFREWMSHLGVSKGGCSSEDVVRLKHESRTTLSRTALKKKAEWLEYAPASGLGTPQWQKIEQKLYGVPFYRTRTNRPRSTR